ncbi:universal stress protein A-like protein isoform X2 [Momordica charantia]|uniref:Universal stress protein A-like protein isoform X2 n=1 Tax=Momordica charantia TaxID=3673 RepID=A0A6J1D2G2_MOMCH|nr:universal stress protein A-like protein isoform X2 [Momordica charantia]
MATTEKPVIVIGFDDSEYSTGALEWTLDHFFSSSIHPFKIVVVYAKPMPDLFIGVGGPGRSAGTFQYLDEDLKKKAAIIIETAKQICASKSVTVDDVKFEVDEGDARYVLCEAVGRHRASMLVVGSHGYGAVKRAFLGSVSDYCAHQASCTVLIVKKPKTTTTTT